MDALEGIGRVFGNTVGRIVLGVAKLGSKVLPQRYPEEPAYTLGVDDAADESDGFYGLERPDRPVKY